jgi:hypothetical protein
MSAAARNDPIGAPCGKRCDAPQKNTQSFQRIACNAYTAGVNLNPAPVENGDSPAYSTGMEVRIARSISEFSTVSTGLVWS